MKVDSREIKVYDIWKMYLESLFNQRCEQHDRRDETAVLHSAWRQHSRDGATPGLQWRHWQSVQGPPRRWFYVNKLYCRSDEPHETHGASCSRVGLHWCDPRHENISRYRCFSFTVANRFGCGGFAQLALIDGETEQNMKTNMLFRCWRSTTNAGKKFKFLLLTRFLQSFPH